MNVWNGWICIYRKLQEHWIWNSNEPFDKRSAWIDILLSVNHDRAKIKFDNTFIEIEKGEMITSLEKLSKKWKWSRHKVSNFLNALEKDGMLTQIRDNKKTLIKVENYSKYQFQKIAEDMSRDR